MRRVSPHRALLVLATLLALPVLSGCEPLVSRLVAVRAAHHPGYDRVAFEFTGPVPAFHASFAEKVYGLGSGEPLPPVAGHATFVVHFGAELGTIATPSFVAGLPSVKQVKSEGSYEHDTQYAIGLDHLATYTSFTLTNPSRVVFDFVTDEFATVRVFLFDARRFAAGTEPYYRPVSRPVTPPSLAQGALEALFAGPTPTDMAGGLSFLSSKATGFTGLGIARGYARVMLTGGCSSGGSTASIASEIIQTLKQFPSVKYVKIYDPGGGTANQTGPSDSIPNCLEP